MPAMTRAVLFLAVLAGLLSAQVPTGVNLGRAIYPEAGLVAVDEVTVAVQTVGADGFLGSFDDSVAILRDIGGKWSVVHVVVGVMTPGLIALGGGKVATVTSGVDGRVATLDDAVVVIHDCALGTPSKQSVPLGGAFVGDPAQVEDVRTEDLISSIGGMRVAAPLSGPLATPPLAASDVVALVDVSSASPTVTHVDAGTWLHRMPPSPHSLPGEIHEVLVVHGRGADQAPTTEDDVFVVVERSGSGPWTVRSAQVGCGFIDGWRCRTRRFDSDHAVAVLALPQSRAGLSYSPPADLEPSQRASVAFLTVSGMEDPADVLTPSVQWLSESSRWLPPAPSVRHVSAFVCLTDRVPNQLVEFTDLDAPEPTLTWHAWPRGWINEPVIGFVGQSMPIATSRDGAIATPHPQVGHGGGWTFSDNASMVSETVVLNEGVVVQLSSTSLRYVENVTGGGVPHSIPNPPGQVLTTNLVRLSGGSVAALSAGFDGVLGNTDDGIMVWTGLPGVTVLGQGHPERSDGGPRLRVADGLYPRATSTAPMRVLRDQAGPGAPGSWRWGFLLLSAQAGFQDYGWGRSFLSFSELWQLAVLDPAAGVGSTGIGVSYIPLPGNVSLVGVEAALQWIVHNPLSPWGYDTSNGLQVRFGL